MIKYECEGYIYDPAVGDPDAGIDPETAFEDIPDQEKMFSFLQKTKQKMQVQNCQTLKDPKRTYKRNGGQIMTYDLNITFDDNLVTGNETIDTQHKELIDRIQNFVTACQNGDSKVKAIKMLDYLDEYTDFHFKEEEKLQEKSGYPEREKHYEKHEEFRKTIQELYEYLQEYEGPTDRFSELVQKNVIDWLFGHIKTYDRSVAKFIFMKQNPDRC